MDVEQAKGIVISSISEVLEAKVEVKEDMHLIGEGAILDSMGIVEVCLSLEEAAEDMGFEFDWTSEEAMSKTRSMFRTVKALSEEFAKQSIGEI